MDLATREERQAYSIEKHYLGPLCLRNHDAGDEKSWRHRGHRNCVECTREGARAWKAKNPERAKVNTRRRDIGRRPKVVRDLYPIALNIGGARTRAKEAGLPFDLTSDAMKLQWREQGGLCFWTSRPIDFFIGGARHPFRPSLDRIVPAAGYIVGNVVWASNFANRARGELPADEFAVIMTDLGLTHSFGGR